MNISLFREFIVSVPICCETEACTEIWQRFQQVDTAMLLVVNSEQRPLGLLRLERLLPLFSQRQASRQSARQRAALTGSLQAWLADHPADLEPIQTVFISLAQGSELRQNSDAAGGPESQEPESQEPESQVELQAELADWLADLTVELLKPGGLAVNRVAVDSSGRALGQIDKLRLLQYQLQRQLPAPAWVAAGPEADPNLQNSGDCQILAGQSSQAVGQSASQSVGQPVGQSVGQPAAEPVPHPLLDLLERLPLPLMLQTDTGHVISQNLAWRQQVGAIQHPQQIRHAAAQILETVLSCRTNAKQDTTYRDRQDQPLEPSAESWPGDRPEPQTGQKMSQKMSQKPSQTSQKSEHQASWSSPALVQQALVDEAVEQAAVSNAIPDQPSVCHFGTEPNTCVCVCPMQNGQERVWQFIKIPMGTAALEAASDSSTSHQSSFKLASLQFNPVPNWQRLMQTAQLWLIWAQDVTEQQQVAKELAARNADLVQLNRLKDEFLACISHELKTPLTAVLGMSSLLKDHMIGDLNERQSHYAQLIYRGGRHLIAIVNNILDLTRTETGQLELMLEQVHIPKLCQQAYEQSCHILEAEAFSPETAHPDLNFQLEIQPELRYIVADELRLKQMLMNLLSNAIKFTEPGQPLGLRVEKWEGWIAFTVWDSGVGIPAEKQHLIFQKFQQLEDPLTRQFQGTGLGLVLTQQLARLHGGEVTFTSVAGQGSQFTLLLPPVPPQASAANSHLGPSLPAVPSFNHNRLILLVEAEAHQLPERLEQLTELGYRPVVARSGTEAIEKARRLQPAAILLNPTLPQLSGWDVLTLLKADSTTQAIPLVVTAVRVQKDQAYQNGADGFLNLPLETSALKRCFERLIHVAPPSPPSPTDLTVLHLSEGPTSLTLVPQQRFGSELTHLLHPYHCRVLEVDDLEQADLLVRVWKPDVVLIDQIQIDLHLFIQRLRNSALAKLPLIAFSAELTRLASQSGLTVFHYPLAESLAELPARTPPVNLLQTESFSRQAEPSRPNLSEPNLGESSLSEPNLSELVQMMQLAAGRGWVPHVLIADCAGLERCTGLKRCADLKQPVDLEQSAGLEQTAEAIRPPVRALVQYLQTAGFRSAINHNWDKICQKLNQQSVDLLLLCVSSTESPAAIRAIVQALEAIVQLPPILVWCYPSPLAAAAIRSDAPLESDGSELWQSIATQVLPASVSILELLAVINQTLAERRRPHLQLAKQSTETSTGTSTGPSTGS